MAKCAANTFTKANVNRCLGGGVECFLSVKTFGISRSMEKIRLKHQIYKWSFSV